MESKVTNILAGYGLENAYTKLIRDYDNLVYQVEAGKKYALRICSPNTTKNKLKTEIDWLMAIRQDTDLLVPQPVSNIQEDLISQIKNRYCVLFEWLEEKPVSRIMSPEIAKQVGKMMATLHLHASDYHSSDREAYPKGNRQKNLNYEKINCFDRDYFFGSNSWWQTKAKKRLPNNYEEMLPAIEKAHHLMKSLDKSSKQFGMIHSDLHFGNMRRNLCI